MAIRIVFAICLSLLSKGHSNFTSAQEIKEAVAQQTSDTANGSKEVTTSKYPVIAGIGAAIRITESGAVIAKLVPGSAAEKSEQLREGDLITAIGSGEKRLTTKGMQLGEVVSSLRGPVGSDVTLEISPASGADTFSLKLTRQAVSIAADKSSNYDKLIGASVPNVTFRPLDELEKTVKLADLPKGIVVLEFWASWCPTCYAGVEKIQQLQQSHPDWDGRVQLIAVTVDSNLESASEVIKRKKWTSIKHFALNAEDLEATLKIPCIPAVMIVNTDGKIQALGDPHSIAVEAEIETCLSSLQK